MADELYKTPFYNSWDNMKRRATSPKNRDYYRYGAIGRGMVSRWKDFCEFKKDMYKKYLEKKKKNPDKRLSLDRIDNTKGYSVKNCRWATQSEQMMNTSRNVWYEIDGVKKTLTEWADFYSICYVTVAGRIKKGWDVKKAFETPPTCKNQYTSKRDLPTGVYLTPSGKYCARYKSKQIGTYETIKEAEENRKRVKLSNS